MTKLYLCSNNNLPNILFGFLLSNLPLKAEANRLTAPTLTTLVIDRAKDSNKYQGNDDNHNNNNDNRNFEPIIDMVLTLVDSPPILIISHRWIAAFPCAKIITCTSSSFISVAASFETVIVQHTNSIVALLEVEVVAVPW